MNWSILTQNDLNTLRELGIKLKSGTKWEQTLGDLIVEYTNDRIPVPTKDVKDKPMFSDSDAVDEALAH